MISGFSLCPGPRRARTSPEHNGPVWRPGCTHTDLNPSRRSEASTRLMFSVACCPNRFLGFRLLLFGYYFPLPSLNDQFQPLHVCCLSGKVLCLHMRSSGGPRCSLCILEIVFVVLCVSGGGFGPVEAVGLGLIDRIYMAYLGQSPYLSLSLSRVLCLVKEIA